MNIDEIKSRFAFLKPELRPGKDFDDLAKQLLHVIEQAPRIYATDEERLEQERSRQRMLALHRLLSEMTIEDARDLTNIADECGGFDPRNAGCLEDFKGLVQTCINMNAKDAGIKVKAGKVLGFKSPAQQRHEFNIVIWALLDIFNDYIKTPFKNSVTSASTLYFRECMELIEPGRFSSNAAVRDWVKKNIPKH